ncbi:DNA-3-methyladenine glycosylase 2 family protein [Arthrobacter agilis]|uniref:Ada metal-binding domain-containing protein n=1 Tax=Arthrobacter agilis TaxID=37921 RepID=UPI000B36422B|nr:Ada metal-binding domain-containing protein [Arthrobacter agilis]OUM45657.1 3-methyladenine DNA glycosylase [Arthrobacter agilis]PPB44925.1 DNA-3-methyladenine glycosylase 2 family protein [Arthrobacter agilis]TPV27629.1 DNA-3-methyladenine glycosylase 2 family protein [Arthrobacter agilis]VDR31747.1 DNA-3-methyladenine glycosylase 2 [Arthrobacter agilis]
MDFWQQYRAIDARDVRFDGQFVTGVSSTGIYCRPSCPARTPKPANVTFFRTSAAAHDAGYRACKRCLPEAVPGDPGWNLRNDVAGRAMRLIADGEVERTGVPGLAAKLGYSARHLNRILKDELGAAALALARAHRAQTARTLLTASPLRLADIAFAAGFGSIRQFNDTVQQVFDLTPGQLRDAARRTPASPASGRTDGRPVPVQLTLPVRLPYDNGIFRFLAERAVDGVERATGSSYERLLLLPGGPAWFRAHSVEPRAGGRAVLPVTVSVTALGDLPALLSRIRRLFDLDADPTAADTALGRHPVFAELAAAVPGLRLPGSPDPHEILVRAVVGQEVDLAAATRTLGRLAASGPRLDVPGTDLTRVFPPAQELGRLPDPLLRGLRRRNDALRAVAEQLADGRLCFDLGSAADTLRADLLALDGVGAWTADYVTMRVLGAPDIQLPSDAAVRNGWQRQREKPTTASPRRRDAPEDGLAAAMDAVRPWRSYATLHLWRVAAGPASGPLSGPAAALSPGAHPGSRPAPDPVPC